MGQFHPALGDDGSVHTTPQSTNPVAAHERILPDVSPSIVHFQTKPIIWPRMRSCLLIMVLFVVQIVGAGCVERLLQVKSNPPGAAVYVNGALAGETPLDHRFTFYGTVDVDLRAAGHLAHAELKPLPTPWYQFFPLDLVSELLVPWKIQDVHLLEVALVPAPEELDEGGRTELRTRAEEVRALLENPRPQNKRTPQRP